MSPYTILVAEDNPLTCMMLRGPLEAEGSSVVEASGCRAALAEVKRALPELVLKGSVSADMTGAELTERLCGLPGGSGIHMLCLSGSTGSDQGHDAESARSSDAVCSHVPDPARRREGGVGWRVLVVDNDPIRLELTALHLELLGFEVASARAGAEALHLALAVVPDVILSEAWIPEQDGFQLCVELRKEPRLRHVPVVLASAWYETEPDRELARRVGATALVRRTPDLGNVASALLAAIGAGRPRSDEAPSAEARLLRLQAIVRQLEQQVEASAHVARRCTLQATQISLLGGVADALASNTDADAALSDILGATVDAAGLSKGALYLKNERGQLALRLAIGFTSSERARLSDFFGQMAGLEDAILTRGTVIIPTTIVRRPLDTSILVGAGSSAAQIVSLTSEGRGVGALVLFASATDVMNEDSIAFARAMGNQLAQSFELANSFARLAESERRYRAVTESAHDAISILRPDGEILDINRSFAATLGRCREHIVGHKLDEFEATGRDGGALDIASSALVASLACRSPVPLARADGTVALIEFSSQTVDLGGEELVVAIGRDVTERVETQAQLMFSDRMATIGSLAAGVAHEINNPLTATIANLDIALQQLTVAGESDAAGPGMLAIEELLRDAGEGAARVATIVRDLKIFARSENDICEPVDVVRILESSLRMARSELRHRAEVVREYSDISPVEGNELRLGQVFLNLLVNAAQALPEGHAHQNRIVLRARSEAREFVAVEVEDTGVGIAAKDLPWIFKPFFTTKPRGVGTGIGLSICQRIVTSLGGNITVKSEVGRGTVFRVLLRAARAQSDAGRTRLQDEAAARRGRILIVDQDSLTANAVRRVLASEHDISMSRDAAQASTRIAEGERFDVIICDLMMPEKTGAEFFNELRASAPDQAERIIFVTGGALASAARDFLGRVSNPCLAKPFEMRALRTLVDARLPRADWEARL